MPINKFNYEEYMLDYLEGNLTEEMYSAVATFLQQHPDIGAEIEGLQNVAFIPDEQIVYPNKAELKKEAKQRVVPLYWRFRRAIAVAAMLLMALMIWQVDVWEQEGNVLGTDEVKMPVLVAEHEACPPDPNGIDQHNIEQIAITEAVNSEALTDRQKRKKAEGSSKNRRETREEMTNSQLNNSVVNANSLNDKVNVAEQTQTKSKVSVAANVQDTKDGEITNVSLQNQQVNTPSGDGQTAMEANSKDAFFKKNPLQRTQSLTAKQLVQSREKQPTKRIFQHIDPVPYTAIEISQNTAPQISAELLSPKNTIEQEWVMNDLVERNNEISPFRKAILPEIFTFNRREKPTALSVEIPVKTPKQSFFRKLFKFKKQ